MENTIKLIVAFLGTAFTFLLGKWDTPLIVLIVFMVLDYITGIMCAFLQKELCSEVGFKGISKKVAIFIILIISVLLDRLLNTDALIFRTMVCYFYIANEGISIIENCVQIGIPVPSALKNALVKIKKEEEEKE